MLVGECWKEESNQVRGQIYKEDSTSKSTKHIFIKDIVRNRIYHLSGEQFFLWVFHGRRDNLYIRVLW